MWVAARTPGSPTGSKTPEREVQATTGASLATAAPAGTVLESSSAPSVAGAESASAPVFESLSYSHDAHGTRRLGFRFTGPVDDIPVVTMEDLSAALPDQVSMGQQPQTGTATICNDQHFGTSGSVELLFPASLFGPRVSSELLDVRPVADMEEFAIDPMIGKIIACPQAGDFVQVWIALAGDPTLDRFDVEVVGDVITLTVFDEPVDGPVMRHSRPSLDASGEEAEVRGVLELESGCLYVALDEVGERYPVVWPYGMRWDPTNAEVVPPTGPPMPIGSAVYGGGGYYSVDDIERIAGADVAAIAEDCVDNVHGEIAVVNNSDAAIGLAPG
jgi:hypothetical protein